MASETGSDDQSKVVKRLVDLDGNLFFTQKRIGGGGQGLVYTTDDPYLAIKQPIKEDGSLDDTKDYSALFERIRFLPLPQHLAITSPLAILRNEPGYVMRLMRGGKFLAEYDAADYEDYRKTGGVKPRLQMMASVATTLARLHAAGIVYGDISPTNIYVDKDDWSSTWLIDPDNLRLEAERGDAVYTPGYGAPELVSGVDGARPTSDVWAFAVMAFRLLTMLPDPFTGRRVLLGESGGWDDDDTVDGASSMDAAYVDDPDDDSNRAENGKGVPMGLPREWVLTSSLRELFRRAFCEGRSAPWRRPSMLAFAKALWQAADESVVCPSCGNSFYHGAFAGCPWCDARLETYCVATTAIGGKIVLQQNADGRYSLPQRLFGPFYPVTQKSADVVAEIDWMRKRCRPMRGSRSFPQGLAFEFIG